MPRSISSTVVDLGALPVRESWPPSIGAGYFRVRAADIENKQICLHRHCPPVSCCERTHSLPLICGRSARTPPGSAGRRQTSFTSITPAGWPMRIKRSIDMRNRLMHNRARESLQLRRCRRCRCRGKRNTCMNIIRDRKSTCSCSIVLPEVKNRQLARGANKGSSETPDFFAMFAGLWPCQTSRPLWPGFLPTVSAKRH